MKNKLQLFTAMLLTLFVISSNIMAQYSGGIGTEADPYKISTVADLNTLSATSADWSSFFIQTADIDASSTNDGGSGFSPIGNTTKEFEGTYDGQSHTIDGLFINRSGSNDIGFIGRTTEGAVLKNIGITNANITGDINIGALIGMLNLGTIEDCYSTGSVAGVTNVGGLAGIQYNTNQANVYIRKSYSECNVAGNDYVGGLVGDIQSNVSDSYSTGAVTGSSNVGGFAGSNISTISHCFATGAVTGTNTVGGFIGYNGKIIDLCYATGDVDNGSYIGGFMGGNGSGASVTRCHSTGDITGVASVGGFVGYIIKSTIYNSYALGSVLVDSGSDTKVGAFCGSMEGDSKVASEIYFCYSIGSVVYKNASAQSNLGFIGYEPGTNVLYGSNYFDGDASNQTTGTGATSATTNDMQEQIRLYTDEAYGSGLDGSGAWDFNGTQNDDSNTNDYWFFSQDGGYPILVAMFTASTTTPSSITENSATSGGHVFNTGSEVISDRGVCWSTSSLPNIVDDSKVSGNTSWNFTANITGLSASTTYYVRAYVTNHVGTSYGDEEVFTTLAATPVELTSFTAVSTSSTTVVLNWNTATEVNNYGFDVESKRASTDEWETIVFVEGHGNSNSPKDYSFIDTSIPLSASSVSYRLKQIGFDGAFEYSDIVTVEISGNLEYKLSQNHPNPFNPSTQISFTIPSSGVVKLNVYNILGEVVTELVNENLEAGFHQYQFDASNLTSGIYFYSISVNGFTEVKKMNLVK